MERASTPAQASPPGGPSLPPDIAADPFGVRNWPSVPHATVIVEMPTRADPPPPLPFTYAGSWSEKGTLYVVLMKAGRTLVVSGRTDVDEEYRVDAVDEQKVVFFEKRTQTRRSLPLTTPPRTIDAQPIGTLQSLDYIRQALPAGAPSSWTELLKDATTPGGRSADGIDRNSKDGT
ncbi:hypothetical protein [Variovorax saccharolyticus]|uniref:hypothetical protein n=1 Tax=Variovorax saccharolyticus TaxID=3053516 RepID=UPI002575016C|nr:hypothetical protein [Variovorax sp. J31P216]MDM0028407.1 hypothetical protein [Variovorax sp. J31P216]